MTTTDPWLEWLESKIGITEDPAGSNHTPIGVEFGWDRVAWCCETQSLATLHAFGKWVLRTAGVADAIARAKNGENGMQFIDANGEIQVGDLACFDFGTPRGRPEHFHISGIVNPGTQAKFETIGGNEGDAVRRQWRDRKYVQCFIRLPFQQVGLGLVPQEDDMPAPPAVVCTPTEEWSFVRGTDGALYVHRLHAAPGDWVSYGGVLTSGPDASLVDDGRIVVNARGADGATWRLVIDAVGKVTEDWTSIGGLS